MISAMPAVAVRRERRKSQMRALSRDGSVAFDDRRLSSLDFDRRLSIESRRRSSILSTRVQLQRQEYERERRKSFLVQSGAVCITTGIIVSMLAVSLTAPALFTVCFIMLSLGCLLFLIRCFMALNPPSHVPLFEPRPEQGTFTKEIQSLDVESLGGEAANTPMRDVRQMQGLCVTSLPSSRRSSFDPRFRHGDALLHQVADSCFLYPEDGEQSSISITGHMKSQRGSCGDSGVDLSPAERLPAIAQEASRMAGKAKLSSPHTLSPHYSMASPT